MVRKLFLFSFVVSSISLFSQSLVPSFTLQQNSLISVGNNTPFWLLNAQSGKYTNNGTQNLFGAGISNKTITDTNKIDFSYCFKAYVNTSDPNESYFINDAYLRTKIYFVEAFIGMDSKRYFGVGDSLLSSGSLSLSNNARPVPSIALGTYKWFSIPYISDIINWIGIPSGKDIIQVQGILEHGWFIEERFVDDVYYHHKNLYVKVGGDYFINATYGLDHFAQWGGVSPKDGELPSDLLAYRYVFLATHADTTQNLPYVEKYNRLGNHVGSRIAAIDVKLGKQDYRITYQTLAEDGSGIIRNYINKDGLWSLTVKNLPFSFINKCTFEYLHTKFQSGPVHDSETGQKGNDDYYNNGIYLSGWSNNLMGLGNPLLTSPIYYDASEGIKFINNRVMGLHAGLSGEIRNVSYVAKYTYSENYGRYSDHFRPTRVNQSVYLKLIKEVENSIFSLSLASDAGEMYGNNFGVIFGFTQKLNLVQ